MTDPGKPAAFTAEIVGIGVLKKRTAIRIHSPHSHQDYGRDPSFRSFVHVFSCLPRYSQRLAYDTLALARLLLQFGGLRLSKGRVRPGSRYSGISGEVAIRDELNSAPNQ
jgi:hypothetical protein